jgi:L-threonylcarbamoyladenylate synthase
VHATHPELATIAEAAALLQQGRLVAFPTETVYGLGADALNAAAIQQIFIAKARPASDPLIIHLATVDDLPRVVAAIPPVVERLAAAFWPGPLTLILPRGARVPLAVSAGRETVAVRLPSHPVARALIQAAETPVAAPSANRFGHTSPTTAAHVLADLDQRIDMVLDAGATTIGVESTVLDLTTTPPTLLRPGGVSLAQLRALLGAVATRSHMAAEDERGGLIAPGQLARHYAPETELWLCIGQAAAARSWLAERICTLQAGGQRVGLLIADEDAPLLAAPGTDVEPLGSEQHLDAIAHRLYAALRALDARRPDVILARDFGEHGIGLALRDRLMRAASGRVVWVG